MPLKITKAVRLFEYNGVRLPDPNSTLDIAKVKEILALTHPEIATSQITGPAPKNGQLIYTVERAVGSKG